MSACAHHLASFYALTKLPSDNLGRAYLDPEVWDKVDPSVEDQAFLVEQADQQ